MHLFSKTMPFFLGKKIIKGQGNSESVLVNVFLWLSWGNRCGKHLN